jgi:hypothetical protein
MPNYIPDMLSHLCPSGCGSASSPVIYTFPASHTDMPSSLPPSTTLSPPVSSAENTWIQRVAGSLLFYARALDLSILTAVCQLSSYQSNPTQLDLTTAHRLLNDVSSHPDPHKTIHPSSMALWVCTDASYLSRPKAGSVTGCWLLGWTRRPTTLPPQPTPRKSQTKLTTETVELSSVTGYE